MKKGFTLTEILITLAILGIVSILTVPNFTRGMYKKTMIATLKSTYSQLQTAITTKMADDGVYTWNDVLPDSDDELPDFAQSFLTDYLDVAKICNSYDECFGPGEDDNFAYGHAVLLNNKAAVYLENDGFSDRISFKIDVNGPANPNKIGVDKFRIIYDLKGVYRDACGETGTDDCTEACTVGQVLEVCFGIKNIR